METIETTQYKGLTVKIHPDYDSEHLGEDMRTPEPFHTYGQWNGYNLFETEGRDDEFMAHVFDQYNAEIIKKYKSLDYSSCLDDYYDGQYGEVTREKAEAMIQKWMDAELIILPIYVYEHGGITMRTSGFGCQWDSGQAGYIYMSKAEARKEYSSKRVDNKNMRVIEESMREKIEYFAAICEGSVYGYTIEDEQGEQLDSCWGFVETDYPIEETGVYMDAMSSARHYYKTRLERHIAKKKAEIINRVPVLLRTTFSLV